MRRLFVLTTFAYLFSVPSPAIAQDRAPVMTAPATASGLPGTLISFAVFASDPDGDAITSLTAAPLPSGATFSANGTNTSGTFQWTPPACGSSATVTFTAANALSGAATTVITAQCPDRAPILTAPAAVSGMEGSLLTFTVSASDPDGEAISTLTASGSAITAGATFSAGAGNIRGTLNWTPTFTQAGTYSVTFMAANSLSGFATTSIDVANVDRAPVVTAPATASACENVLLTFTVGAIDPDGDAIASLTAAGSAITAGATFAANAANTSGTLSWTPTFTAGGSYFAAFTSQNVLSGSAGTTITVSGSACARPPVVTAPASTSGTEGALLTVHVTASDPDGDAITSLTASGTAITAGGTFAAGPGNTSGTFNWTPTFTQSGTYSVTFRAASTFLTGSSVTSIDIANMDRAPVVTAPATRSACENTLVTFTVGAIDPEGDAIASLTAAGSVMTAGATFAANAANTSGTFSWTPTFTAAGSYTATFTAQNALSGSAATTITVGGCDRAPVVIAPATSSGLEGSLITFTVAAFDPDGQAVTSFTASGTAISAGATFTKNGPNTSGTFSWTPTFTQAGDYSATFFAANALSGSATTNITVADNCGPPFIDAPSSVAGPEGSLISFTVTAADPAGDPLTSMTASGTAMAAGATFTTNASHTAGTINWTPSFSQAGSYTLTITVCGSCGCWSETIVITVTDCNRTPALSAPSSVAAAVGVPVSFTVGAATCGGESLTLTASGLPPGSDFSVSPNQTSGAFSWTPGSGQAGTWPVTFTATVDGGSLSNSTTTVIDVAPPLVARAFTVNAYATIRLGSEKAFWCAGVEAIGGSFNVNDIVHSSVMLISPGTGSVDRISVDAGKFLVVGDADKNDVEDAKLCFRKEDLRLLFSNVNGKSTVNVTLAGSLTSGREFSAPLSVEVVGGGGNLAALVTPNPLNPSGILSFVSTRSGTASIRIFSQTGRLVRTLKEGVLPAGRHEVRIDGRDEGGKPLATGIYFYRVDLVEGAATGRFTLLK